MTKEFKYSLFEVFGVELEYMIVNGNTLQALPICDQLLFDFTQNYSGDFNNGSIDWSNELVAHVVEIKVAQPVDNLTHCGTDFHNNIQQINRALEKYDAMLLPTAAHPLFDPESETKLWPHENNEIYALYNKVFNCEGHGWSNLQSIHINLPFKNDEEFAKLHAAIRVILPLIPALSASSPVIEGTTTGYLDTRMYYYINNQSEVPSLMGELIPEAVFSEQAYYDKIFAKIIQDFQPYDTEGVMEHHFLNSRGAIARFDRGAIEIRVTDIQECPAADLSILNFIVQSLKYLIEVHSSDYSVLQSVETTPLFALLKKTLTEGLNAPIEEGYAQLFKLNNHAQKLHGLISELLQKVNLPEQQKAHIQFILSHGNLSERILQSLEAGHSVEQTYQKLAICLQNNQVFKND